MNQITLMGECMVEFGSSTQPKLYKQGFAGDVFNTAIYIKRCMGDNSAVHFLSAIGQDSLSDEMLQLMYEESLDTHLVYRSNTAQMGLYLINVDEEGERSFTYWRDTSAAKQTIKLLADDGGYARIASSNMFFLSGISIAILSQADRVLLWHYLAELKANGTLIVFDPNYRPALWSSVEETKQAYNLAFELADIALPGVDDHMVLYGAKTSSDVANFLNQYDIKEYVIKNGSQGMHTFFNGIESQVAVEPVKNVVDTTSAGDAFNGGYLSARMMGRTVVESAEFGAKLSACVIGHKGAIVDKDSLNEHLKRHPI